CCFAPSVCCSLALRSLPSLPTRRSSDLADGGEAPETEASEAPAASGGELNVYNWSTYIAEDTIPNFEQQFGVKVNYDVYESNERSEEHTSGLQSRENLVCRLLLEKKNNQ